MWTGYIRQKLWEDRFIRSVLTLMGGAAAAQAIPIAISPIIARIYKVEDFGVLSVCTSLTGIIGIIAAGRYELAVMLPRQDEDAVNIMALSAVLSFLISIASLGVFWGLNHRITQMLGDAGISTWLYFIPLSVFLGGTGEALNCWTNRKKRYKRLSLSRISQTAAVGAFNLSLGFAGAGVGGLIAGGLAGQILGITVLIARVVKEDRHLAKSVSWPGIKRNAWKYRDFPGINSLHAFADLLQSSGIELLISGLYGNTVLGLYSFTLRMLKLPMGLIGSAVGQVFYQRAAEVYHQQGDLNRFAKSITQRLFLLALPAFIPIVLFAPQIFSIFLGDKWYESGVYAQILSPSIFMQFIVSPVSYIPIIMGRQKTAFLIGLAGNLLDILTVACGFYFGNGVKQVFLLLSLVRTAKLTFLLLWYYKISAARLQAA